MITMEQKLRRNMFRRIFRELKKAKKSNARARIKAILAQAKNPESKNRYLNWLWWSGPDLFIADNESACSYPIPKGRPWQKMRR